MSASVGFSINGSTMTVINEGNWRNDNPRGFAVVEGSPPKRWGKGWRYHVVMGTEDALDLANYIQSVAELWAEMSAEERGDDDPRPLFRTVRLIREAVEGDG